MACFLGFVGQKALKTQKTRRSVSRADGLPNLSILSFSSSCAAKEKLPHVKYDGFLGAIFILFTVFSPMLCHKIRVLGC